MGLVRGAAGTIVTKHISALALALDGNALRRKPYRMNAMTAGAFRRASMVRRLGRLIGTCLAAIAIAPDLGGANDSRQRSARTYDEEQHTNEQR
jgi:hypothetical protein